MIKVLKGGLASISELLKVLTRISHGVESAILIVRTLATIVISGSRLDDWKYECITLNFLALI